VKAKLIILLLLSLNPIWAQESILPSVPQSCFKVSDYCIRSKLTTIERNEVLRIRVFAQKNISPELFIQEYFNFNQWKERLRGSRYIRMRESLIIGGDQENNWIHRSAYRVKGPLGVVVRIEEVSEYRLVEKGNGLLRFNFGLTPHRRHKGIQYKSGDIILKEQEGGVTLLIFTVYIRPRIFIAPPIAKKYILRALDEVFSELLGR
jgi:hypothetical protein